jgi:general secretion pathway protein L
MKSIGIDIGSSSIKVVEVTSNNKGQLRVTQFIEQPLNSNPAFDPEIQIIEFLTGLAKGYDPASTRFVLGLRQDRVSVRHKIFPFSDRLKINRSLPFEMEEDLPFSADSAVFDAKVIRTLGPSAEVLACATPKHRVANILKRFGEVGFEISVLSTEGMALANCYENWFEAPPVSTAEQPQLENNGLRERNVQILISIGHTTTIVNAIEDGRLVGVRSILWGGKLVAEAISRRYEIPYVEALKEMQSKAFILPNRDNASYDQIVFSDTISAQFKDLCRDLKISLLELKSELNATVEAVQLTGGCSQVINLQAFMTQMLEAPVNRQSLLDKFAVSNFDKSSRIDSVIGVALGLAIEGLKKPRNPAIQFLRGEFAKQNTHLKQIWETWGVTAQFLLAFYVAFFAYSFLRENISRSLADRTVDTMKIQGQSIAKLPKKLSNESGINKYIREQKNRAHELKTVSSLANMNSALDILKKINDATPAKNAITLNVKKFKLEENQVVIEGFVASPQQVSLLQRALAGLAVDGKIQPRAPTIGTPKGWTVFAASFQVDRGVK